MLAQVLAMVGEERQDSIEPMPWANLQSKTPPHVSSTWVFFESILEVGEENIKTVPALRRENTLLSTSTVDNLNPTLQRIFDWADEQVDQNFEDAPISTSTDFDGLRKEDKVVNIYRRKQDLTVTLREDVWSAVAVLGVRIVQTTIFMGIITYHQEFLICIGHINSLKVKWKTYKEIKELSKLAEPLCLIGAISVYKKLLKPTETIFADNRSQSLVMSRLIGTTTFVSQVLAEL